MTKRGRPRMNPPEMQIAKADHNVGRMVGREEVIPQPFTVIEPSAIAQMPEWLTEAGRMVWRDEIGHVTSTRMVTGLDSTSFGNYCNLQGAINLCWMSGEVPATTALAEARRRCEAFGLDGRKSRIISGSEAGAQPSSNPFAKNGRRS